ncbi:MAG TPA: acyl-CoA reductase, partial [Umezawaea sp.]|nr:acyl-CoA reductase [Umezawaea sp.]
MAEQSVSWIPSWVDSASLVPFALRSGDHEWRGARPGELDWPAVAEGFRVAREALREVPVRRIVEAVDVVAERWAKRDFPPRQRVVRDA